MTMRYKSMRLPITEYIRWSNLMRAFREFVNDPDCAQMKYARRLRIKIHDFVNTDWSHHSTYSNLRSWKAHSKCRHQWEKHEVPVIWDGWNMQVQTDHYRKWIMDCLHQKGTYTFNTHNDDIIFYTLGDLFQNKCCTKPQRISDGIYEVTLLKQDPGVPRKKSKAGNVKDSYSSKIRNIEDYNYMYHINIGKRPNSFDIFMPSDVIAERTHRNHCGDDDGPVKPQSSQMDPPTPFVYLLQLAAKDRITGVTSNNMACLNLLYNYSLFSPDAKTHVGLAPYDHDYREYHTMIEQCCVWLTGRRPCEFPSWVFHFLTKSAHKTEDVSRLLHWSLGNCSVRQAYGLTKNEAREILHLPASIQNEQQAITAAITRTHHCNRIITNILVKKVPDLCNLLYYDERNFLRKLAEWLGTLTVIPSKSELHDLLDYLFRSGIKCNPDFSFKGRSYLSMETQMNQWHLLLAQHRYLGRPTYYNIQEHARIIQARLASHWPSLGYGYVYNNMYRFIELTTGGALQAEGQAQHNCVFSYCPQCITGNTSIVSMRNSKTLEHLTIEINNRTRKIVQIREVCNRLPSTQEMTIVKKYASIMKLAISC